MFVELCRRFISGTWRAVLIDEAAAIPVWQSPMVVMVAVVVVMVMIVAVLVCVDVARERTSGQIQGHEDDHDNRDRPPQQDNCGR